MSQKAPVFFRRCAGLLYGQEEHYLDHLAPLCCLLRIPLFVTEEEIASLARMFYPGLQVECIEPLVLPEKLIHIVDLLFVCTPKILVEEVFFLTQKVYQKQIHTVWCPHGNSDKGHLCTHMEALYQEEAALVYGQKMVDFLQQKNVFAQLKEVVKVSNFRHQYYLEHQKFYDSLFLQKVAKNEKVVLYAPTWKDAEGSSSFYEATEHLVKQLPVNWTLIIKPHPNLARQDEIGYDRFISQYSSFPRVIFLERFPPIYALLANIDVYIGDFSSIGYDFLTFNKPMFFLNSSGRDAKSDLGLYLYQCGIEISKKEYSSIYEIIRKSLVKDEETFSLLRETVYQYTFGKITFVSVLRDEIFALCEKILCRKDLQLS
jgi:hypothetical protein